MALKGMAPERRPSPTPVLTVPHPIKTILTIVNGSASAKACIVKDGVAAHWSSVEVVNGPARGRGRTRTGTPVSQKQILSLLCLPFHHAAAVQYVSPGHDNPKAARTSRYLNLAFCAHPP